MNVVITNVCITKMSGVIDQMPKAKKIWFSIIKPNKMKYLNNSFMQDYLFVNGLKWIKKELYLQILLEDI